MNREEILAQVRQGRLTHTQAMELIRSASPQPEPPPAKKKEEPEEYDYTQKADRQPPHFRVAEVSGWCSVYFAGLRRPFTMPAELWEEILKPENADRLRAFLAENRTRFRSKKRKLSPKTEGAKNAGEACPASH